MKSKRTIAIAAEEEENKRMQKDDEGKEGGSKMENRVGGVVTE